MIVYFAVGHSFALHKSTAHERLATFATREMFVMPVPAERRDNALLVLVNRLVAGCAHRHSHFVVASLAVKFTFSLFAILGKLRTAASTREMVGMVGVLSVAQQFGLFD